MSSYNSGPYRSRRRMFFGVCRGLADYFNFSVFWTRALVVIAFIISGFFPVGVLYLLLALLMKTEPRAFAACYSSGSFGRCAQTGGLDERIRRMEASARSRQYDWDSRLHRG
jgi:phage shock protein C